MNSQSSTQAQGSGDKIQKTFHNSNKLEGWEVGSRYQLLDLLGKGSYGQVAKGMDKTDGKIVAIKQMRRVFEEPIDAKRAYREMHILGHLRHPGIVPLLDVVSTTITSDFERYYNTVSMYGEAPISRIPRNLGNLYLIFEYFDTDLSKIIKSNQFLSTEHIQYIMQQILDGLRYLHKSNVIHRDIKPANILVSCADCTIKIADFGLARVVGPSIREAALGNEAADLGQQRAVVTPPSGDDSSSAGGGDDRDSLGSNNGHFVPARFSSLDEYEHSGPGINISGSGGVPPPPRLKRCLTKHVVTRWYRAPEVILGQPYGHAVDMWSMGCVFAELLGLMRENNPNYRTRRALFPGERCGELSPDESHRLSENSLEHDDAFGSKSQLGVIFDVMGTPRECDIQYLDPAMKQVMRRLKPKPSKTWKSLYPAADDDSLDLLASLMQFDPHNRLSAEQALGHPFFSSLSCLTYLENYQNANYPPRITAVPNRIEQQMSGSGSTSGGGSTKSGACSAGGGGSGGSVKGADSAALMSPHSGLTPVPMNAEHERLGELEENLKYNIVQEILVYRKRDKQTNGHLSKK